MDKETIEHFLLPFNEKVRLLCRMPDGKLAEFEGIQYGFVNDGEGVVILELPEA